MRKFPRVIAVAVIPAAVAAGLAAAGPAHASTLAYSDTSVQAGPVSVSTITGAAAARNVAAGSSDSDNAVKLSGLYGLSNPLTYKIRSGSVVDDVSLVLSTDGATVSGGNTVINAEGVPADTSSTAVESGTVVLTASDTAGDVAVVSVPVTVTAANTVELQASGTVVTDEVTGITSSDDNAAGAVDFSAATSPAGSAVTVGEVNLPSGLAPGNPLDRGTAVPGRYTSGVVATDAAGAVATGTFRLTVNGHVVKVPGPVLSHGFAVKITNNRENVEFESTLPALVKFTIIGPGAINGHTGYVHAAAGLNTAVYGGLEYNHHYTVIYQPLNAQGQPDGHWGYVTFLS